MAKDADFAVKMILDAMSDALVRGDRIEIRGFGSFALNYRPPRVGRNPKSGETKSAYPPNGFPFQGGQGIARAGRQDRLRRNPAQCGRFGAVAEATAFLLRIHESIDLGHPAHHLSLSVCLAATNTEPVALHFIFGPGYSRAPLVIILCSFFAAGALLGCFPARPGVQASAAKSAGSNAIRQCRGAGPRRAAAGRMSDFFEYWQLCSSRCFGLGWAAARIDIRQVCARIAALPRSYFQGLNFPAERAADKAIDSFLEVAKIDPQTVELHFALGNLFGAGRDRTRHSHARESDRTGRPRRQLPLAGPSELGQDYLKAGLDRPRKFSTS